MDYRITSDNGPQFVSEEFANYMYMEENAMIHHRTIPLWSQVKGEVERQNGSLSRRIWIAHSERKDLKRELYILLHTVRHRIQLQKYQHPS